MNVTENNLDCIIYLFCIFTWKHLNIVHAVVFLRSVTIIISMMATGTFALWNDGIYSKVTE